MVSKSFWQFSLSFVVLFVFQVSTANAQVIPFDRDAVKIRDHIKLRSGQKLFGKITKQIKNDKDRVVSTVIRTDDGSTLKLDNRFVANFHIVDRDDEIYNNKVDIINDDAEGHWSCVTWLGKQKSGSVRYKDQIQFHLKRIMELDPNDTKVKARLNYKYIEEQDRWVPEELYYKNLGFVRKGSSWVPVLQGTINESNDAQKDLMGNRKRRFTQWKKAARNRKSKGISEQALAKDLFDFVDAPAVGMIFEEAKAEFGKGRKRDDLRIRLYIEALGKVPNGAATQALVFFAVNDPVRDFRDRALDLLMQPEFNNEYAASHLARFFNPAKNSNATLQRAAFCIGELKAEGAILPLISVLKTTHVVKPAGDPNRMTTGIGAGGNVESFSTGGSQAAQKVEFSNREVLGALRNITNQQDIKYDEVAWRNWYVRSYTILEGDVRGDD